MNHYWFTHLLSSAARFLSFQATKKKKLAENPTFLPLCQIQKKLGLELVLAVVMSANIWPLNKNIIFLKMKFKKIFNKRLQGWPYMVLICECIHPKKRQTLLLFFILLLIAGPPILQINLTVYLCS